MGKYIIAGNWKMNKLPSETYDYVKEVVAATEGSNCEVVCCTPYVCLTEAVKAAAEEEELREIALAFLVMDYVVEHCVQVAQ